MNPRTFTGLLALTLLLAPMAATSAAAQIPDQTLPTSLLHVVYPEPLPSAWSDGPFFLGDLRLKGQGMGDLDADGIPDHDELSCGSNLLNPASTCRDPDADGLRDANNDGSEEHGFQEVGTSPENRDTDGDGYEDGAEVVAGYDPLDPTSNPGNADGDGDGVTDGVDNCPSVVNSSQDDLDANGRGDACEATVVLLQDDVLVPNPAPGQELGSVLVYDAGGDVCVDVSLAGAPAQNIACVARALLGPADGQVPRGQTGLPAVGAGPVVVDVLAGYHHDDDRMLRAASLLGGSVEVWSPFGPSEWTRANGDAWDLFIVATVTVDGDEVETVQVRVPFVGQALAAAGRNVS